MYAGTVLEEGELTVQVKETSGSNKYERIVRMIEESERLKSGVEGNAVHLADQLVPYTLLGTSLVWLLTRNATKALAVLMVDFSCALKLAIPISVLSAADVGIAISDGAQLAREIADITIDADSLSGLILLGISGMIQPAFSALVHNLSTLIISLNSMKNLLEDGEPEGIPFFLSVINSHQKNIARISLNP